MQLIGLKLSSEFLSSTSYADDNTQSMIDALAEDCNVTSLLPASNDCYHGAALPPKEFQLTSHTFDDIASSSSASE